MTHCSVLFLYCALLRECEGSDCPLSIARSSVGLLGLATDWGEQICRHVATLPAGDLSIVLSKTCFCSLVNPSLYFLSCRIEPDSHIENLILEGILRLLSQVLGMHSRGQWPGLLLGPCPVVLEWGLLCSPSHITHFPSLTLFTFSIFPQTPLQSMLHLCLLCDYPLCTSSKLHTLQHLCAWASLWKQHWEPVLNAHAPAGAIKVRGCQGEMFIIHPGSMVSNYC